MSLQIWARNMAFALFVLSGCGGGKTTSDPEDPPTSNPALPEPTGEPTIPPVTTPPGYTGPTWHQDVAPLLADRCGACHRAGGVGPFSVETYEEASTWGFAMLNSIEAGTMPPFYAVDSALCDMSGLPLLDDIRLSEPEKQMMRDWIDAEMPLGDPAQAAPAPLRQTQDITDYDLEIPIQEEFAVTESDVYQCFRIPLPNTERMYLTALQVVPDNELVMHHVIVWTDPNDYSEGQAGSDGSYGCSGFPDIFPTEVAGTWTPGSSPMYTPEGTAMLMEPGGSLVLNIHYHTTGTTTEFDQSKIRLKWTDEEPQMYTTFFLVDIPFGAFPQPGPNDNGGAEFRIPAGEADHLETVTMSFVDWLFFSDLTVFSITPHMHFLGTEMLVNIEHTESGGGDQCLVHTPNYRYDFQAGYTYDLDPLDLPIIHRGDKVRVQCRYNNSTSNPFMPMHLAASGASAPHDVYWGEETGDEMCMAIIGLIVPDGWSPLSWF